MKRGKSIASRPAKHCFAPCTIPTSPEGDVAAHKFLDRMTCCISLAPLGLWTWTTHAPSSRSSTIGRPSLPGLPRVQAWP